MKPICTFLIALFLISPSITHCSSASADELTKFSQQYLKDLKNYPESTSSPKGYPLFDLLPAETQQLLLTRYNQTTDAINKSSQSLQRLKNHPFFQDESDFKLYPTNTALWCAATYPTRRMLCYNIDQPKTIINANIFRVVFVINNNINQQTIVTEWQLPHPID